MKPALILLIGLLGQVGEHDKPAQEDLSDPADRLAGLLVFVR
jgi:hypothetical protein